MNTGIVQYKQGHTCVTLDVRTVWYEWRHRRVSNANHLRVHYEEALHSSYILEALLRR